MDLSDLQRRAYADSHAWFPAVHQTRAHEVEQFTVGLIGELGELVELLGRRGTALDHLLGGMVKLGAHANTLKKQNRACPFDMGDPLDGRLMSALVADVVDGITDPPAARGPVDMLAIRDELADCAIYLIDLAASLGVTLADAIEDKRAVLIERWGEPAKVLPS